MTSMVTSKVCDWAGSTVSFSWPDLIRAKDAEIDRLNILHASMLAYMSDVSLLHPVLAKHGVSFSLDPVMGASLDHALWFHRRFRMDEWLLYSMESPNAGGARGYTRGQFFTQDGTLVASTTQEGLIRVVDPAKARERSNPREQV